MVNKETGKIIKYNQDFFGKIYKNQYFAIQKIDEAIKAEKAEIKAMTKKVISSITLNDNYINLMGLRNEDFHTYDDWKGTNDHYLL